ncbi:MAG: ExeA family protein [Gammaproteobacteria bacterium]
MYYRHFGLEQPPFRITPDTRLFFPGGNRGAVLEALVYAVSSGEGIVKVVGEVGSGKTMLCRMLEQELPDNVDVVYLANPTLTSEEMLHAIALELKLAVEPGESRLQVMHRLQAHLLDNHARNRRVVVFIEEAQGMPLATLEEIRLLSNLETQVDKLLQIVLFGQPELDEVLAAHGIRQLRERITYSFHLQPLNAAEIGAYVQARLRASGARVPDLFHPAAIHALARLSQGLLRRVNILADKALLAAYADNAGRVGVRHVRRAAADSGFAPRRPRWLPAAAALALIGTVAGGGWLALAPMSAPADLPAAPPATSSTAPAPQAAQPSRAAVVPAPAAVQPPGPDAVRPRAVSDPAPVAAVETLPGPAVAPVPASSEPALAARAAPPGLLGLEVLEPDLAPRLGIESLPDPPPTAEAAVGPAR